MKTTIGVLALAPAVLLLGGPGPASAADEQTLLQYTSRDTGVPVEKLQQEKSETGLSPYDLREPWHVVARSVGLSPRDIERIVERRRRAARQ